MTVATALYREGLQRWREVSRGEAQAGLNGRLVFVIAVIVSMIVVFPMMMMVFDFATVG